MAVVKSKAMLNQCVALLVWQYDLMRIFHLFLQRCVWNILHPYAEVLVYAVAVVNAAVELIWGAQNDITSCNGVEVVLDEKGYVPGKIDVNFIKPPLL